MADLDRDRLAAAIQAAEQKGPWHTDLCDLMGNDHWDAQCNCGGQSRLERFVTWASRVLDRHQPITSQPALCRACVDADGAASPLPCPDLLDLHDALRGYLPSGAGRG